MISKKLLAIAAIAIFALSSAQADQAKEKSGEMRTQAEDAAKKNGNEKAQEMRDRRDQRKEIMDAEKSDDKDSHLDDDGDDDHADDDGEGEGKTKEKKPWWKFWDD